ncbi:MBL fold metallo-hydrolase [Psychroflexus lacisalsi]|jgi:glyoxylase-like metal-dependent hydrolase (beta-lactamase superfamily II)/rhodanese-related sulfurtransferase|uniref:MBL fold metallo-hydrolase n=1 Tax=Psychroflexus lacisalsi TaxID=503928 RepID=A0ABN1KA97_9FLAO|nr:rhodanese-like domain-containing protein [Psychroflexus lacisalsi]MBZ9619975.1 MBL fold metallo-hydrolase [Psychroflexus lacisalsi]
MTIKQYNDKPLSHLSYAIVSNGKMAVVDPARDPQPYYEFAEENNAKIVAVFETHPHADFVSSHLQIHKETGATIYVSKLVGADYPHHPFDEGDELKMEDVTFKCLHTPGHSPDGITVHAVDAATTKEAIFTGDTLFIGDVGRPDLREKAGNMTAKRRELAQAMYKTMTTKYNHLSDNVWVYPAHGAGSLCGKNMSDDTTSTLGNERIGNWAFQEQTEEEFVSEILDGQPFIPAYFGHDVDINKTGAENFRASVSNILVHLNVEKFDADATIVDTRPQADFKANHIPGSINIMARSENDKIETWIGAIIKPNENFYLVLNSISEYDEVVSRIAKIGYESQIKAVLTLGQVEFESSDDFDYTDFKQNPNHYTIIDIRNISEFNEEKKFESAKNHPLNELRDSAKDIPTDKPIVVHCAGGYRSAAGSSIIEKVLPADAKIYDLSERINDFN